MILVNTVKEFNRKLGLDEGYETMSRLDRSYRIKHAEELLIHEENNTMSEFNDMKYKTLYRYARRLPEPPSSERTRGIFK